MSSYSYVKAPPGYTLEPRKTLRSSIRYGISLLFLTLGIATFTTVAYPLITYQLNFAPQFQQSNLASPLSPVAMPISDYPIKAVEVSKAVAAENPTFASEVVNTSFDYTDSSTWFATPKSRTTSNSLSRYTISISKLGIDYAVVRNDHTDLKQSLIHYQGTAMPGDLGNAVIFGHSVLPQFFNPQNYLTIFSTLHTLRPGDTMEIESEGATYTYKIAQMYETAPDDLSPLAQTYNGRYLTLITCTPPGTYLRRLIIKAYLL